MSYRLFLAAFANPREAADKIDLPVECGLQKPGCPRLLPKVAVGSLVGSGCFLIMVRKSCGFDRSRLLTFSRRWLYDHQLLVMRERDCARHHRCRHSAVRSYTCEDDSSRCRCGVVGTLATATVQPRESSLTTQTWLWMPPAKHSTVQIDEMLERIETLYALEVQHHLREMPDDVLRRYARRLASRPPSAGQLIREPGRTIEVACFQRYCLLTNTDRLLLMVRRRVADLWRRASQDANRALIHGSTCSPAAHDAKELPVATSIEFGKVWKTLLADTDRDAQCAPSKSPRCYPYGARCATARCGLTTAWPSAVANACLLQPRSGSNSGAATIGACRCPQDPSRFLEPLIERVQAGVAAVATAAEAGELRIDDELHLTPLAAEEDAPELKKLRAELEGTARFSTTC